MADAKKYVDLTGLGTFLSGLKNIFPTKTEVDGSYLKKSDALKATYNAESKTLIIE